MSVWEKQPAEKSKKKIEAKQVCLFWRGPFFWLLYRETARSVCDSPKHVDQFEQSHLCPFHVSYEERFMDIFLFLNSCKPRAGKP